MIKNCFGTIFTLLCQIKSGTQYEIFNVLTNSHLGGYGDALNSHVSRLKNCKDELSSFESDYIQNTSIIELTDIYKKQLSQTIKTNFLNELVLALREIVRNDGQDDNYIYGDEAYTKKIIIECNKFNPYEFLVCLLKDAIKYNNESFKDSISEISNDFISNLSSRSHEITLIERKPEIEKSKIEKTIIDTNFNEIFVKSPLSTHDLDLPNESNINCYRLKLIGNDFSTSELSSFIMQNVGRYVYSRSTIDDLKKKNLTDTIALRAANKILKTKLSQKDVYTEIMLYSFLECVMNAPKILSNIEIINLGPNYESKNSGVYLLPPADKEPPQIIFGSTKAEDNIFSAVDSALEKANEIKINMRNELRVLDKSVIDISFDKAQSNYLIETILPNKHINENIRYSFGIFISYAISVPNKESLSNNEYKMKLEAKMDEDIISIKNHIVEKIKSLSLTGHSFYLFFLPLNEIDETTKTIMDDALIGGE